MKNQFLKVSAVAKRFLALALIAALVLANPLSVEAKTKVKTLKSIKNNVGNLTVSVANSCATEIKAGKSYKFKLKQKNHRGLSYVKFTAPATKDYTFTLSKLSTPNGSYANGFYTLYKQQADGVDGLTSYDNIKTNAPGEGYFASRSGNKRFPKTRKQTVSLNAGDTVYIFFDTLAILAKHVTFNFKVSK
ncbi:hypothetical protein [Butyrivibrio sp. INlla16]|uniref:hypothetical protein n=1 Tax=Butyrivibrio sp. INlla16 TaxID=1520807 RepID=UPI00088411BD|nr:hypothetical protein [Butyrivibrio sp. INlla16]SDB02239.1 hypothetical protein SAMN02910263_00028 [Butyrivibrio sp. INlla16]